MLIFQKKRKTIQEAGGEQKTSICYRYYMNSFWKRVEILHMY